jgi:hypothetical protein
MSGEPNSSVDDSEGVTGVGEAKGVCNLDGAGDAAGVLDIF